MPPSTQNSKARRSVAGGLSRSYPANSLPDKNGAYLIDCRVSDPWEDTVLPWATSPVEAERLWKLSEKLVGEEFAY